MLQKVRCNPMPHNYGALLFPYMPVWVTHGALVGHRYTYAPPRCKTSRDRMTFILLSLSLWNDLAVPVFDGVDLTGFKSRAHAFSLDLLATFLTSVFPFYSFFLKLVLRGWGLWTNEMCTALSQPCIANLFLNNNNKNNNIP